ncbi:hypothetical protein C8Q79DRAFT_1009669 [Trametes meyenii]|nr:hypothetical protein C8Q79DRAFT_1009669 [Trametes meyenii]
MAPTTGEPLLIDHPEARVQQDRASIWQWVKVFIGYQQPEPLKEKTEQQLYMNLMVFLAQSTAQVVLTATLTVYGITRRAEGTAHEGQSEFVACKDLAIVNILWLARIPLVGYLLIRMNRAPYDVRLQFRLDTIGYLSTIVGLFGFQTLWIMRSGDCRSVAPHISMLTFILVFSATIWFLFWHFGMLVKNFKSALVEHRATRWVTG